MVVFDDAPGLEVVQTVNVFEDVDGILSNELVGVGLVGWGRLEGMDEAVVALPVRDLPPN